MKRVGILNFQYSTHNYGAVLQAAALEYICRQLGHEAQHLDYIAKPKFSIQDSLRKFLRSRDLKVGAEYFQVGNEEAFERFRRGFINRTPRIKSPGQFSAVARAFDAVIVGSDQVWRPAYAKDVFAYFLGYVPTGVDRIAYAASFGVSAWQLEKKYGSTESIRNELRKFKAISCREASGLQICKSEFGVEAEHVIDPLLLVDDFFIEEIVIRPTKNCSARLVYYKLDNSPEFQLDLRALCSMFGVEAVNIYFNDSSVREYREVRDWVALIRNSEVVVTDSYHCICLALRFRKCVIYCPNESRGRARLDSLFSVLGITVEPLGVQLKTPMFQLTSREAIKNTLESLRSHSINFLIDALDD